MGTIAAFFCVNVLHQHKDVFLRFLDLLEETLKDISRVGLEDSPSDTDSGGG